MKIKDVIVSAFRLLGRSDIADLLSDGGTADDEQNLQINTLLYCLNAVEDELARNYFPVTKSETIGGSGGKFYFSNFIYQPVRVLSVKSGGGEIEYAVTLHYIQTDSAITRITVEYEYAPSKREIEDDCLYDGYIVSEMLEACGALAEYCMISGESEAGEAWENKYRSEINRARSKLYKLTVPERRWV